MITKANKNKGSNTDFQALKKDEVKALMRTLIHKKEVLEDVIEFNRKFKEKGKISIEVNLEMLNHWREKIRLLRLNYENYNYILKQL